MQKNNFEQQNMAGGNGESPDPFAAGKWYPQ